MCLSPPPVKDFPSAKATDDRPLVRHCSTRFAQMLPLAITPLWHHPPSAGNGLRASDTESHAGFHFTFALVELALFDLPDELGRVVMPSTLAKTTMIPRGIVELDEQHRMAG